ncbi:MAG: hypothetical protein U1E01_05240, partial [Methylicorpusculum sp.]|nr:hypothetical protein [Methylicorpusculum sp.]
ACLISLETSDADKMSFYLQEAKDMGLAILPPNINTSAIEFSVVNNAILFGLQGTKSVGMASLENIMQEQAKKPFTDLLNFCTRIDLRTSNKRVLENLIYAGAFDTLPGNRAQKIAELETIMDRAAEYKKSAATGQMGLFARPTTGGTQEQDLHAYQPLPELSIKEKLEKEREVIGFYLSAHPLDTYKPILKRLGLPTFAHTMATLPKNSGSAEVVAIGCGLVKSRKDIFTKKGDRMSFLQMEDAGSTAEIILFPKTFAAVEPWLENHHVFIVRGGIDLTSGEKCKIKANALVPLDLFFTAWENIQKVSLTLPLAFDETLASSLKTSLVKGKIPLEFIFQENGKKVRLTTKEKISLDDEMAHKLEVLGIGIHIQL